MESVAGQRSEVLENSGNSWKTTEKPKTSSAELKDKKGNLFSNVTLRVQRLLT